jgi:hypothetical protein
MNPTRPPGFPSIAHRLALFRRRSEIGSSGLPEAELWQLHAYHYGFRRAFQKNHERTSPVDPGGRWFDPALAKQAERMFAAEAKPEEKPRVQSWHDRVAAAYRWAHDLGQPKPPPGTPENDPRVGELVRRSEAAQAARAAAQDRELAPLRAKIVGDGKGPDGSWSPEAIAHAQRCLALLRSNMGLPPQATDGDPIGALQRALGISATEAADDDGAGSSD